MLPLRVVTSISVFVPGLLFNGPVAIAQEVSVRLAAYESAICFGNPVAAEGYLKDEEARKLGERGENAQAELVGKAEALRDLKELLAMNWGAAGVNKLNKALTLRLTKNGALAGVGVGPEPERVLDWISRFQPDYPACRRRIVETAIRSWDVVFGTAVVTMVVGWDQADIASGREVELTRKDWAGLGLRERNAVLAKLMLSDRNFLKYSDEAVAAEKKREEMMKAVEGGIDSGALSSSRLKRLSGKSLEDQAYLLGSFFDKAGRGVDAELELRIDAARDPLPVEVLDSSRRELLGVLLSAAVSKELYGTKAGGRALAGGPLKIEIRPCGAYSAYDAPSGVIALDSETIQQFMRIRGYSAGSLLGSAVQLATLAKYMSPAAVYEAGHKMQAEWAAQKLIYKPHVQEDEIEAISLEGLYIAEKLRADSEFADIFLSSRDFSDYALKKLEIGEEYGTHGSKKFAAIVRKRYFPEIPSLSAATALALGAVSGELSRRDKSGPVGNSANSGRGSGLKEALQMSPVELSMASGELESSALYKIQKDLLRLDAYKKRYNVSERMGRVALKNIRTVGRDGK